MQVLQADEWRPRAAAHAARVDALVGDHLGRRRRGEPHPVHDFLFTYYSHRPAQLRRWHPGFGVVLADGAAEFGALKGYAAVPGVAGRVDGAVAVTADHLASQRPLLEALARLLRATAGRQPTYSCFGLHEWAMVHRAEEHGTRHPWPLRLGAAGTDAVVEGHRVACSHFDAYRFFTPSAVGLNTLSPGRDDREAFEQPGCLHAGMDLYKHAFRLSPLVPSELVLACFELASDIRELDMRAAPYDLRDLGYEPVRIETAEGKQEYAAAQRAFAERGAPLRAALLAECERLLRTLGAATG